MSIVFVDIETTGLDPRLHVPWEIALVDEDGDTLLHERIKPAPHEMEYADPMALKIGGYYERMFGNVDRRGGYSADWVAQEISLKLNGKTLGGAAVAFDSEMLKVFLRNHGQVATWSHRLLDIQAYCAGALGNPGLKSLGDTARDLDIKFDPEQKHTALYDALLARECYSVARQLHGGKALPKTRADVPSMPKPPPMEK